MDDIIDFLDLKDDNVEYKGMIIEGNVKFVILAKKYQEHYCPKCSFKMYSRGVRTKEIRNPILQDGYHLILKLEYRQWRCSNPLCKYQITESFPFVGKGRRTTNATDILIVRAFSDFERTVASIAKQFNVSDQHVLNVFDRYIHMERLTLPEILSVDEVHLDMDRYCKYALVLMDFKTNEPIDLIVSRRKSFTEPYFIKIPRAERMNVKYLISDMYNPYINYTSTYFPNAVPIVDSFHVMQWIITKLDTMHVTIQISLVFTQIQKPSRYVINLNSINVISWMHSISN